MANEKLIEERLVKVLTELKLSTKTIEKAIKVNEKYKSSRHDIKKNNEENSVEKKQESKPKKMNATKRTLSAYQLFSKDIRDEISREIKNDENNKDLNGKEINNKIMKEIGERWSNINDNNKKKYEENAKRLKEEALEDN